MPPPPDPPAGPTTAGDPLRGLEDDSPETVRWQSVQDAAARDLLRRQRALAGAFAPHVAALVVAAPIRAGGRRFALAPGDGGAVALTVADAGAAERTLVATAGLESLDWWWPSPDGRFVAYGLSAGGDEQSVLHVVEVASGRVLPERLPHASFARVAWLADASGFWYSAGLAPDTVDPEKHLFFHRLGDTAVGRPEPVSTRWASRFPQLSPDGRYLAAVSSETEPRPEHVRDLRGGGWRPFLRDLPGVAFGEFDGDAYVAVTDVDAPRGRVVRIPLADPDAWEELVPEGDAVIRSVALRGGRLVLGELLDGDARIRVVTPAGRTREVRMPAPGGSASVEPGWSNGPLDPPARVDDEGLTFLHTTTTSSPGIHRFEFATGRVRQEAPPAVRLAGAETVRGAAVAADGADVPYRVVRRAGLGAGPHPAVIWGYGGWNVAHVPTYHAALAPFVAAGGVVVLAHLRGGSELGYDRWRAGRLARKQATFDDLHAVADRLLADGVTAPARLAVAGWSNGGLLALAVGVQRPERFGAVVALMPLADMLRFDREPYPAEFAEDYGDPRDADAAAVLAALSPLHNVRPAAYPATLVVCAENDIRCPPWHGRKMVAALQAATTGTAPVLLRLWRDAGHLAGASGDPRHAAEWVGFVAEHTGLALPAAARDA